MVLTPEGGTPPAPPVARADRDRTVATLCRHFARDHLDVGELERRLDVAYAARTRDELERILADLPALPDEELAAGTAGTEAAATVEPGLQAGRRELVVAVLGSAERRGSWTPPRRLVVLAFMGGGTLDFREARFGAPEAEVTVVAVMGGVEIIVPPWIRVEVGGAALMSAFEHRAEGSQPAPGAPLLRVNGFALMSEVKVRVRLPGESERDARRRLREERKRRLRG